LPGLLLLLAGAAAATLIFQFTDLDMRLQKLFHRTDGTDPWPFGDRPPWNFLYHYGTIPAVLTGLAALVTAAWSALRGGPRLRRIYSVFLILSLLIGPVIVVNGLFKDKWGRPRPREITEFGGMHAFVPAVVKGTWAKGRSFPCGHASTGFYLGAFYFVLRNRRRAAARAAMAGSVVYGTLIGIARMAAGAHFASDVVFAALMTYGTMFAAYWWLLRIPAHEAGPPVVEKPAAAWRVAAATLAVAALGGVAVLLATPFRKTAAFAAPSAGSNEPPAAITVSARAGRVTLLATPLPDRLFRFEGEARGFGLPWSGVKVSVRKDTSGPGRRYVLDVEPKGLFTELDMNLSLAVGDGVGAVELDVEGGDLLIRHDGGGIPSVRAVVRDGRINVGQNLRPYAKTVLLPSSEMECVLVPPAKETGK